MRRIDKIITKLQPGPFSISTMIISLLLLTSLTANATPISSTTTATAAPLKPSITTNCKQIILQTQQTQAVGDTTCPAGYVAIGIKINSLPNYYNNSNDEYTNQYFEGKKIPVPPGYEYMQLRGKGTIIDATGWGLNKMTYASSTNQSNIPAALRFTYPNDDAIQWRNTSNTIQLICAKRDIRFTTSTANCN